MDALNTTGDCSRADPVLVSIALCTYNGSRFLTQQLDSLLSQTHPLLEIVVADDASSDDTVAILEQYARLDPRVSVSVNPTNLGFARNFECALARCRGTFIAPCDQDDVWLPDKISALVAAIGEHALAYCDSTLIDEHGKPTGHRMSDIVPMPSTDDPSMFAFGNCVSGHAMLFRRELRERALPVPPEFFYDWWIAAIAASAGGIVRVQQSLVLYRQHGANVTNVRIGEMLREAGIDSRQPRQEEHAAHSTAKRRSGASNAKLDYFRQTRERLASLARLPGRHQAFIATLHRLWSARAEQWICPSLTWFMMRHRRRLLAMTGMSEKKQKRYCRRLFWGLGLG